MTRPDLTEEDCGNLAKLVREAIDAEPYRIGPRMSMLRLLLAKLEPSPAAEVVTPYPAPKPAGTPSLFLSRKKGRRRR